MKVLSVRQPWAGLIVAGIKTVENRTWRTKYRGQLWIHATKTYDDVADIPASFTGELPRICAIRGSVIGSVELYEVCRGLDTDNPWAEADAWHWCLSDPFQLGAPYPVKGQLGIFTVKGI